ncbi:MAG: hypothetical protein ACQER4_06655 [Bacteroidota bacterium]
MSVHKDFVYVLDEKLGRMVMTYEERSDDIDSVNLIYHEPNYIRERERELRKKHGWEALMEPVYGKVAFGVALHESEHLLNCLKEHLSTITGAEECIHIRGDSPYLIIRRKDISMRDAALQSIEEICRACVGFNQFPVVSIEPGDIVSQAEIARRLRRSNESIRLYTINERGGGGFPEPLSGRANRPLVWSWAEVIWWATNRILINHPRIVENAVDIKSVNMALYLKREVGSELPEIVRPVYKTLGGFEEEYGEERYPYAKMM